MALGVPSIFPPRPELLVNFDWTDFISGAGYKTFNIYCSAISTGASYLLIDGDLPVGLYRSLGGDGSFTSTSNMLGTNGTTAISPETSAFNHPRTINGVCFVTLSFANFTTSNTALDFSFTAKLTLVHADASTTDLTTAVSTSTHESDGETSTSMAHNISLSLALPNISNQLVKKGEKLRLVLTALAGTSGHDLLMNPSGGAMTFSEHVANTYSIPYTRSYISIPFKIEV